GESSQVSSLSKTQLAALTTNQFSNLRTEQLRALSTAQVQALTGSEVSSLTTRQIGYLRDAQVAALTPSQIQALETQDLQAMTTGEINAIAPQSLASLTTVQVSALRTDQLNALTSSQFVKISAAQIGALSPSQLSGFGIVQLNLLDGRQVAGLQSMQLSGLTVEQLEGFSYKISDSFTSTQQANLSDAQKQALKRIGYEEIRAATSSDIAALRADQVASLTTDAISKLSTSQIASLSTAGIVALSTLQIQAIQNNTVWALNLKQMAAFTTSQVAGFTANQVGSMFREQLAAMRPDAAKALSDLPIGDGGMKHVVLNKLTVQDQIVLASDAPRYEFLRVNVMADPSVAWNAGFEWKKIQLGSMQSDPSTVFTGGTTEENAANNALLRSWQNTQQGWYQGGLNSDNEWVYTLQTASLKGKLIRGLWSFDHTQAVLANDSTKDERLAAVRSEFGLGGSVADFSDLANLTNYFGAAKTIDFVDLREVNLPNIADNGNDVFGNEGPFVSYGGLGDGRGSPQIKTSDGKSYFVSGHFGTAPQGWGAVASVANAQIDVGASNDDRQVLAIVNVGVA
ncbi:MAG: hypothetical protein EBT49_09730, partial [Betaproteobacteria bacterium]|nr:hypothetical protein [Betaproteobacteria bacterium]